MLCLSCTTVVGSERQWRSVAWAAVACFAAKPHVAWHARRLDVPPAWQRLTCCSSLPACFLPPQLEAQLLHRKRDGQLEGLTKEQRRLHTAGKMLHGFCTGTAAAGGAGFTGSNLVRCVYSEQCPLACALR